MLKEKSKKAILVLWALQIWATSPLYADKYNLDDIDETYQVAYNKLPAVEESNRLLKERSAQFSRLLEDAEQIVVKYGMETHVGLRLVHSHFPVEKGQVMVEEFQDFESKPSLITCAQNLDDAKAKQAFPASWIFSGNTIGDAQIFETSTDPAVHTGIRMLQENPGFMDEMGNLLRATQFNSLLSISLLKRESLVAQEEQIYIELNQGKLQKSIIQVWDIKNTPELTIRTSWGFKGSKQQACLCHHVDGQSLHVYGV